MPNIYDTLALLMEEECVDSEHIDYILHYVNRQKDLITEYRKTVGKLDEEVSCLKLQISTQGENHGTLS